MYDLHVCWHAGLALFVFFVVLFFFQAEDGIRDLVRSRGLGDVYKRQVQLGRHHGAGGRQAALQVLVQFELGQPQPDVVTGCLLYTSDAADERSSVDLGGRRIIKKKNKK